MNRFTLFLIACAVLVNAALAEESPVSKEAKEGKSVYMPLKPSIDLNEEVRIQQQDQNQTRQGN